MDRVLAGLLPETAMVYTDNSSGQTFQEQLDNLEQVFQWGMQILSYHPWNATCSKSKWKILAT